MGEGVEWYGLGCVWWMAGWAGLRMGSGGDGMVRAGGFARALGKNEGRETWKGIWIGGKCI